jgi:DNA-binding GntR family transcriptional regulator
MTDRGLAALTEDKLRRTSTAEQVAEIVRDAILDGSLLPGTPLREGQLASSLRISRHTFREAMRLLVSEGLVSHSLHRGVVVTQLGEDAIHDLFRARVVLEIAGVEAIGADPPEHLDRLRSIVEELELAAQTENWRRLAEQDLAFHRQIVASLGSRRLDTVFAGIQRELRLGLAIADRSAQVDEHRRLVDYMSDGHWDEVRALLREHIRQGEQLVIDAVREKPPPAS